MYVFCFSKYVIDETGGSYMDAVVEILKGLDYSPSDLKPFWMVF